MLTIRQSSDPLVSVVMPTYNTALYVEEAVRSMLDQTVRDTEVLVIDDGSTDDSVAVVRAIDDPRVRIIHADHGGEGAARNIGIEAARGRFIAWHDSDDVAMPQRLERLLAAVEGGADFAHHDMLFMDPAGNEFGYQRSSNIPREHVLPYYLREGCPFNCATTMLRRSSIGDLRHPEDFRIGVDMDFMRRFAPYKVGVHVPEPLILYRKHPTSSLATTNDEERFANVARMLRDEPLESLVPDAFDTGFGDDSRQVALAFVALCLWRRLYPAQAVQLAQEVADTPMGPVAALVASATFGLIMDQPAEAVQKLRTAPRTSMTLALLGDALAATGDVRGASRAYREAGAMNPASYDAAVGLRATGESMALWVLDDPRRRLMRVASR